MPSDLIYPTNAELQEIAQDLLPRLVDARPVFSFCPMVDEDAAVLLWDQRDNYTGLQAVRGLNGEPGRVTRVGQKRYLVQPGAYGEYSTIDETEMTIKRGAGTFGTPIDITDLVMREEVRLLQRRLDRIESTIWTLFITGTFSVLGPSGAVLHTDSYTPQTYAAATTWSTAATATPLNDFRQIQLLHRGHSVNFGSSATAYMNRKQWNYLINNTNNADLYGRRTAGLGIVNNVNDFNKLLAGDDLPQMQIYDEGYLNDSGTFVPYIPDGKVLVVGKRADNSPVADYAMTRNANNPGLAPGAYMRIIDNAERAVPRSIEIHDGHNGGTRMYFPSALVAMSI